MAIPQDMEAYGAVRAASARSSFRPVRIAMIAATLLLAMAAALVFLAGDAHVNERYEDIMVTQGEKLNQLVSDLAVHAEHMSVAKMEEKLKSWRNDPSTILDLPEEARTQVDGEARPAFFKTDGYTFFQMLTDVDSPVSFHTTSLVDDSTLCAKKDIIISKFNQLLKKLGGEVRLKARLRQSPISIDSLTHLFQCRSLP
jgi:hypothetical protein